MKITTNHQPRPLLSGRELPESARAEFYYYDDNEYDSGSFFTYKGEIYDLAEFAKTEIEGWAGARCDSYFSALLVQLTEIDHEPAVIVGRASW